MQQQQRPDDRAVGIVGPAAVEAVELEAADDQQQRRRRRRSPASAAAPPPYRRRGAAFLIIVLGISLSRMTIVNRRARTAGWARRGLRAASPARGPSGRNKRRRPSRSAAPSTIMKPMMPHQVRLLGPNLWVGRSATSSVKRGSSISRSPAPDCGSMLLGPEPGDQRDRRGDRAEHHRPRARRSRRRRAPRSRRRR